MGIALGWPALLAVAIISWPQAGAAAQEIRTIATRPGVSTRVLLHTPNAPARATLIMFPGSKGANMFREVNGRVHLGNNFLVRTSPDFVRKGFAVVIVDVPSDRSGGMSDDFRRSPQHAEDIHRMVDVLASEGHQPLYLIGTSRGTLSVAYLATRLNDERVRGIVLTASVAGSGFIGVLPLERIIQPVLLVHHRDDACKITPYREAVELRRRLSNSPRVDLVEVRGGSPPQSSACNALSSHGFLGLEKQVVGLITDWISGKEVSSPIGE